MRKRILASIMVLVCMVITVSPVLAATKTTHFDNTSAYIYLDVPYNLTLLSAKNKKIAAKSISWSSSDENIATVNKNGQITGVSEGSAIITATYKKKDYLFTANVRKPYTEDEIRQIAKDEQSKNALSEESIRAIVKDEIQKSASSTPDEASSLTAEESIRSIVTDELGKQSLISSDVYNTIQTIKKELTRHGIDDPEAFTLDESKGTVLACTDTLPYEWKCEGGAHTINVKDIKVVRYDYNKHFGEFYRDRIELTITGIVDDDIINNIEHLDEAFGALIKVNSSTQSQNFGSNGNPHRITINEDGTITIEYAIYSDVKNPESITLANAWISTLCSISGESVE